MNIIKQFRIAKRSAKLVRKIPVITIAVASLILTFETFLPVAAATTNTTPAAKISFTFDDGYASAITQAAPTLARYRLSGTNYITTGCVGMVKAPNTCQADRDKTYMTWNQIAQLKNTYGWEIASHTVTHPYLATSDPNDQPQPISTAQVINELKKSKDDLAAHGFDATDFASPYGDYDMPVLAEIAKHYASQRGFGDVGTNSWPYSEYYLKVKQVQAGVSVADVRLAIDQAIANKQWLVLVLHDIKVSPSNRKDDYEYGTAQLDKIAAYVKGKQNAGLIKSVNVNQGLVTSDTNLLPNSSFNNGIAAGWTTDKPGSVTANSGNNGSYPDPIKAIRLTAGTTASHLFSPQVSVDSNMTYMLKNFLNVQKLSSGEVGFYIDEYDEFGNWVSGQYKKSERSVFVENMNFTYKPSSGSVARARLQVFVTANSGITAFLDNVQWFPLQSLPPTPPPANLIPNSTFDNGIADGWSTDAPASIQKDSNNNGSPSNPLASIKMQSTTSNTHLFSPQLTADSTKTYNVSSYLNLKQISSGSVGFYIDEYDVQGNWISGQYKLGVSTLGAGNVAFAYHPSSVNVRKARLQVIIIANSNLLAYLDEVKWSLAI